MTKRLLLFLLFALPVLAQNHAHMLSGVNAQTGTTYTLVAADVTKVVTLNNAASVAVTIPAASTDGFGAGTIFAIKNLGIGNVTITPVSGTIDGQVSLLLTTGASIELRSDGSNYTSLGGSGGSGGGGSGGSACSVNIVCKGTGSGLPVVDSSISDDSITPVRSSHGLNVASSGIVAERANANPGTTLNTAVCNNGAGLATICPNGATTGILGFAQSGAGTTGNVLICRLISCAATFDNQSVVNDYAIVGSSGQLHDTGSTSATGNNVNFLVLTANTGAGTIAQVSPPGDLTGATGASIGFANPMTTLGDTMYGGASGVATRLPGATTLNGVPQVLTSTAAAGVATAPVLQPAGVVPRFVAGTTDTILFTDRNKFIQYTNASPVAVAVPQSGTTGFASNFYFCAENRGAGNVTFTPTTSTVNGVATYVLAQGYSACFVSDNANYVTKDTISAAGVVSTTGSPANGNLTQFSGASSITNGNLSGDCTTTNTLVVTCTKLNGTTVPASASVLGTNASSQPIAATADKVSLTLKCAAASASGTAYTCSTSPTFVPAAQDMILFKADVANTGAATLNVNVSSAAPVKKQGGGTALVANDLLVGQWVSLIFDGTNWQMQGQSGNASAGGTVTSIATTAPITGGTITSTGTIACALCVTSSSPGAGIAHFAGGTQAVTSSAINLAGADITGTLAVANGGTGQTSGTVTFTIANGTSALGTSAIASGTCASVVTTAATGTATTDNLMADFNADPTSTTGYSAGAMLTIIKYPTANNVNFKVCNNTASSITPGAATLNWRVVR